MDGSIRSEQSGHGRGMRGRRGCGMRGGSGVELGDGASPVVCPSHDFRFGKNRHGVDSGEVLFSELSAATGRRPVHLKHRIGSVDGGTGDRGRYGCLSGRERGLQPGDGGWRTVRSVSGGGRGDGQRRLSKEFRLCVSAGRESGGCVHDRWRVHGTGGEEREPVDASAGIRFELTVQSQLNDLDGVLHGGGFHPWRLELVVDVGHGERSARDQQRRNNGSRGLGLRSSGTAAGCDGGRNAELRRQLPVRRGRVLCRPGR